MRWQEFTSFLSLVSALNSNLNFTCHEASKIFTKHGNAKQLSFIKENSIDLICTHPPYANIIQYSRNIQEDLSHLTYEKFFQALYDVAVESFRVLKPGRICAFMITDIRRKGYVLPLGMNTMQKFVEASFLLKEIIIKEQHNCRSSDYWNGRNRTFLLLAHEYIYVMEKPLVIE